MPSAAPSPSGSRSLTDAVADYRRIHKTPIESRNIAWRTCGDGPPIVLVHGNPTSSYLWRNIAPQFAGVGYRCFAPDLIGMGESDKLADVGPRTYSYSVHRRYFNAWMDSLILEEPILFIGHNWGVPLFFDWAKRHPDKVRGLVHMEGQISPVTTAIAGDRFRAFNAHMHSPEMEADVLKGNLYLTQYFFRYVDDILSDKDRAVYTKPYAVPGPDRRPTLDWPCEIPVDGEPADVFEILTELRDWMAANDLPKLWIAPTDGSIMTGQRRAAAESFSHQTMVEVDGGHYTPETSPNAIVAATLTWLEGVPRRT